MKNLPKVILISSVNLPINANPETAKAYAQYAEKMRDSLSEFCSLSVVEKTENLPNDQNNEQVSAVIFLSQAMIPEGLCLLELENFRTTKIIVLCGYLEPADPVVKKYQGIFLIKKNAGNFLKILKKTIYH